MGQIFPIPTVEVPAARACLDVLSGDEGARRIEVSSRVYYKPDSSVAPGEIWGEDNEPWWFKEEIATEEDIPMTDSKFLYLHIAGTPDATCVNVDAIDFLTDPAGEVRGTIITFRSGNKIRVVEDKTTIMKSIKEGKFCS